jgi:four helix bundle protein
MLLIKDFNMRYRDYKDLKVWQKSMDLTIEVYSLVKSLPREELYGLSDQMRRAAVSVPSNIAEGEGRNSEKDFVRFLAQARGSLWELSAQLDICERLNYLDKQKTEVAHGMIIEIGKMINALSSSILSRQNNS